VLVGGRGGRYKERHHYSAVILCHFKQTGANIATIMPNKSVKAITLKELTINTTYMYSELVLKL
jgi:hypothetical protein